MTTDRGKEIPMSCLKHLLKWGGYKINGLIFLYLIAINYHVVF